jgi:hypothetical protein
LQKKDGELAGFARATDDGFLAINGHQITLTNFEAHVGSTYHRPAEHTFLLDGTTLKQQQQRHGGAASSSSYGPASRNRYRSSASLVPLHHHHQPPVIDLLDDDNDDYCYVCGLGGDLICCESCPATYHAECCNTATTTTTTDDDAWYCHKCRCDVCGEGIPADTSSLVSPGVVWVQCDPKRTPSNVLLNRKPSAAVYSSNNTTFRWQGNNKNYGTNDDNGGGTSVERKKSKVSSSAASASAGVDLVNLSGIHSVVASAKSLVTRAEILSPSGGGGVDNSDPAAAAAAAAAAVEGVQQCIRCPVTGHCRHLHCTTQAVQHQVNDTTAATGTGTTGTGITPTRPYFSSQKAAEHSLNMAAIAAAGVIPIGIFQDHSLGQDIMEEEKEEGGNGNGISKEGVGAAAAAAPPMTGPVHSKDKSNHLPSSPPIVYFQLIRGAAVASSSSCTGFTPAYTDDQKKDLRLILSATRAIIQECYAPIVDSRTGADIIPWLLRGASFDHGRVDFSSFYTGVLYVDHSVVGVVCLRTSGPAGPAEVPVFCIRPEVQRQGLGTLLLGVVEKIIVECSNSSDNDNSLNSPPLNNTTPTTTTTPPILIATPAFKLPYEPVIPHMLPVGTILTTAINAADGAGAVNGNAGDTDISGTMDIAGTVPSPHLPPSTTTTTKTSYHGPLMQRLWKYQVATKHQATLISHYATVHLPGVMYAVKDVSGPARVLDNFVLPSRLVWNKEKEGETGFDVKRLIGLGFIVKDEGLVERGDGGSVPLPPMRGVPLATTTTTTASGGGGGGNKGIDNSNDEMMVDVVVKREPMDVGSGRSGPPGVELPVPAVEGRPLQPTGMIHPTMMDRLLGFKKEAGGGT